MSLEENSRLYTPRLSPQPLGNRNHVVVSVTPTGILPHQNIQGTPTTLSLERVPFCPETRMSSCVNSKSLCEGKYVCESTRCESTVQSTPDGPPSPVSHFTNLLDRVDTWEPGTVTVSIFSTLRGTLNGRRKVLLSCGTPGHTSSLPRSHLLRPALFRGPT